MNDVSSISAGRGEGRINRCGGVLGNDCVLTHVGIAFVVMAAALCFFAKFAATLALSFAVQVAARPFETNAVEKFFLSALWQGLLAEGALALFIPTTAALVGALCFESARNRILAVASIERWRLLYILTTLPVATLSLIALLR